MIPTPQYKKNYLDIVWTPIKPSAPKRRPGNASAYVISDTMDPTMHMVTGRVVDSKAEFRRMTREAGCVEVGNEKFPDRQPSRVPRPGPDIKRAIEQLRGR